MKVFDPLDFEPAGPSPPVMITHMGPAKQLLTSRNPILFREAA